MLSLSNNCGDDDRSKDIRSFLDSFQEKRKASKDASIEISNENFNADRRMY